jgi:hypothetical protein
VEPHASRRTADDEDGRELKETGRPVIDRSVLIVIVVVIVTWSIGVIEGVVGCLVYQHVSFSHMQMLAVEMENQRLKEKVADMEKRLPLSPTVSPAP